MTNLGGRPANGTYREIEVDTDWALRGNCCGRHDLTQFFYPEDDARGNVRAFAETEAKGRCLGITNDVAGPCPVQAECLEYALEVDEPAGVWGGLNTRERTVLLRSRRSRPLAQAI